VQASLPVNATELQQQKTEAPRTHRNGHKTWAKGLKGPHLQALKVVGKGLLGGGKGGVNFIQKLN
jgi:hypothetical protein